MNFSTNNGDADMIERIWDWDSLKVFFYFISDRTQTSGTATHTFVTTSPSEKKGTMYNVGSQMFWAVKDI